MQYRQLGDSGLTVSRVGLGCMSYGDSSRGGHEWALSEDDSQPFFAQAVELGVTFWDTANVYSNGSSEEFTGRALRKYASRESIVLATKVFGPMHDGPGGGGLSRKAILEQLDASLQRLGTDYIDLYQIHRFDSKVDVLETMTVLHDVIKAGKVRYIGASSMFAWQFAKLQETARAHGLTPFVSMQPQYNLVMREEERDMFPMCADQGVGVLAWSPLARGRIARPSGEQTQRGESDAFSKMLYGDADEPIVNAVERVATEKGVPMAQVSLAWVLRNPVVSGAIVGATKTHHLSDAVGALDIELSPDEIAMLEADYTPRSPVGFG